LADCVIKERLSNRDGASFKIYHALKSPIYDKYGLKGETLKLAYIPVSWSFCILRAQSEAERKTWMTNIQQQIDVAVVSGDKGHFEGFSPSEDEDDMKTTPSLPLEPTELAEGLFVVAEGEKSLSSDPSLHVNKVSKALEKKLTKSLDDLRKELNLRMVNMEKKILLDYKTNLEASRGLTIRIQWVHLAVFAALLIISKFIW